MIFWQPMSESKKGVMLKPGFMRVLGEMPAPGLGFYSRHLTEDDVQVISANTRKLIFNNGQVLGSHVAVNADMIIDNSGPGRCTR